MRPITMMSMAKRRILPFNMVSPRDFNSFFQKLREWALVGYRSELDVTMINAGTKAGG
jgi:hypothetical protein